MKREQKTIRDRVHKPLPPGVTLLTRADLCTRWRCSPSTLKRMEKSGFLRPVRLRSNVRYRVDQIEQIESAS
jgi:hypothetical protein